MSRCSTDYCGALNYNLTAKPVSDHVWKD